MHAIEAYETLLTLCFIHFSLFFVHNNYRVGWSVDQTDLGLGEVDNSYGYGGVGKTSSGNKFFSYGEPYGPGDVIGCFLVGKICREVLITCMFLSYLCLGSRYEILR